MKFSSIAALSLASIASLAKADCDYVGGNYYCSQTDAVVYSNVGYPGSYKDVTNMDESSCSCSQEEVTFEGNMAPLNEELSVHFRGPLKLKQFGVYYPSSSLNKRDEGAVQEDCTTVRHKHHEHKREAAVAVVEVTSTVFVGADGQVVATSTPNADVTPIVITSSSIQPAASGVTTSPSSAVAGAPSSSSSSSGSSSSSSSSGSGSGSGSSGSSSDWKRVSYYSPGSTNNCTFMNYQGGTAGSGTWSSCFGNSISFADSDGVSGASSATPLDEVTISSNKEYMIFSGTECSDDSIGDCGYFRSNIPAYHGFGGSTKIFVFEFSMPSDNSGSSYNQDMPAIWLLNAKIPRTLQYGDSSCSCWKTGCGEMDLFEILSAGSDKLITHLHNGQGNDGTSSGGGGTQDYFKRPTDGTLKAAVIFDGSDKTIHIVEVDEDFSSTLSSDTVSSWLKRSGSIAALSS